MALWFDKSSNSDNIRVDENACWTPSNSEYAAPIDQFSWNGDKLPLCGHPVVHLRMYLSLKVMLLQYLIISVTSGLSSAGAFSVNAVGLEMK